MESMYILNIRGNTLKSIRIIVLIIFISNHSNLIILKIVKREFVHFEIDKKRKEIKSFIFRYVSNNYQLYQTIIPLNRPLK